MAARLTPDSESFAPIFTKEIPQHTPGSFCSVCTPELCGYKGCDGWVHHIYEESARWCGKCGRLHS